MKPETGMIKKDSIFKIQDLRFRSSFATCNLQLITFILLFTVLMGCGINKDIYQKTVEESEARKAGLEQAQKEIAQLKDENGQLKNRIDELSKQVEGLAASLDAATKGKQGAEQEIEALKEENLKLKGKIEDLSKQIQDLLSGKEIALQLKQKIDAQAEEINNLKREKESLTARTEYLNREVERLKLKAGELSTAKEEELARVKETYESLMKEMKQEIDKGEIKITQALDRLSVNMVEKILFDSGKAEVKPEGLKILNRVGTILKGITDKQIKIEGHTDNVQIGAKLQKRYPTNWELSTARATNVVRYLQDKVGIDARLLSAAGYSEYKPIAGNDTVEGRAQNRRMEIVLLPLDLSSVVEELKKK
ncbi:MAG: OmpA family protein [Deltaproteobacteria bacterium]|nr:OmpA family protein [Deltaproteobacteria bacterium]